MEISKTTIGVLAVGCLAVGAAGAYFAARTGQPETAPVEAASLDTAARPVDQSEATVAPQRAAAAPTRPPAAARPSQRAAAPSRRRAAAPEALPVERPPAQAAATLAPPDPIEAPAAPLPVESGRASESIAPPIEPRYQDLELPAQSVIGLQLESSVSSETARIEDEVIARVTRDVRVGDRVAIPAGARAHGEVTLVDRGQRLRGAARLGVRFTSIVLNDGTRVPIDTEPIYREGDSVRNENAAKIGGGAIGGAILGGILGGAKGAAIGGSIGAGAGTAAVAAGGRNAAILPSGSPVTVRIERPVVVTIER